MGMHLVREDTSMLIMHHFLMQEFLKQQLFDADWEIAFQRAEMKRHFRNQEINEYHFYKKLRKEYFSSMNLNKVIKKNFLEDS